MTHGRYRTTSPRAIRGKGAQCVKHGLGFGSGDTSVFTTDEHGSAGTAGRNGASSGNPRLKGNAHE